MEVKNPEDLVFSSTETDALIILTSNLEGYEVQKIGTQIKEETTRIADSGEKEVRRWMRVSVAVEVTSGVKRFRKLFQIPDGVVPDKIKTNFNEEEWVLRILMPKSVRGVSGVGVEEVKEEENDSGRHGRTAPVPDKVPETENPRKNEPDLEAKSRGAERCEQGPEAAESTKVEADQVTQRAQFEEYNAQAQLKPEQEYDQTESLKPDHPEEVEGMENEVPVETDGVEPPEEKVDNRKGSLAPSKKSKLCSPLLFAGSAILVSIGVLVIRFSRSKRR